MAKLQERVSQPTDTSFNLEGALALAEEFLEAPSAVWRQARFETKVRLQLFQFPSGVIYDGKKFGTTEVSLLFATESVFSTDLSSGVEPRTLY